MTDGKPHVSKRRVFYIPGYDPHPPRRYRELYRTEGAEQAKIAGYRLDLRPAGRGNGWEVAAEIDGRRTRARFEVLGWADIVQATMAQSLPATYLQMLRVIWVYVSTGALRRLTWLGRAPLLAAFYPIIGLLLQALAAIVAGRIAGGIVAGVFGWLSDFVIEGLSWAWLGWLVGLAVAAAVLVWARRRDGRVFVHYLMHDFAYSVRENGAYPPELAARITAFAERIGAALEGGADEVLVVGHSSGATLAVSALAELLRSRDLPGNGPALSLLSLGQAIPMTSFLPGAARLRRDLHELSKDPRLAWVDVSAPGDGCCFALTDAVAVTGVAPAEGKLWPLVVSAAFSQTLSPARLKALKRRYFRLHFQYLCAFDDPSRYDYFRITAGPETLAERFAGRPPSASRIDVPASGHVSMAA